MTTNAIPGLITTCAVLHMPGPDPDETGRVCMGHCPACHEVVWDSDDPVWTCPANLSLGNPHHAAPVAPITEDRQQRDGVYSWCGTDFGYACHEDMPLHSACYGGETATW